MGSHQTSDFERVLRAVPGYNTGVTSLYGNHKDTVSAVRNKTVMGQQSPAQVEATFIQRRRAECLAADFAKSKARMAFLARP